MSEDLVIQGTHKAEIYHSLLPQLCSLVEGETDTIANVANLMAGLKEAFGHLWIGCYFVKDQQLVLGPFQGPVACTRIAFGKGVCGTSWKENRTVVVDDVDQFPGHIACSSKSRSEIVVPIRNGSGEIVGVIDVDSEELAMFDHVDQMNLEIIASWIGAWV